MEVVVERAPDDGELERIVLEYARRKRVFTAREINRLISPLASEKRITRVLWRLEGKGLVFWTGRYWVYNPSGGWEP